ncbi:MAG TPA: NifU family protein [Thermoanaerobacterales bacterium]|nr:NifU family protein [Thermoanaerobacterales bacterium]
MKERVQEAIDKVRPGLQADGGDVVLVDVDEQQGIVKVKLTGSCQGCPFATITLTEGIEKIIKAEVPEVKRVVAV